MDCQQRWQRDGAALPNNVTLMVKENWKAKGYVDDPVNVADIREAINELKRSKNAVILAHYYQQGDIQDIADYVGDSLALAQWAARTDAEVLVMCGVHFMGETAKLLCPDKRVIVPDLNAGCSLANSCQAAGLRAFIADHPGHTVISYVNTSAAVKALTDIVVTSGNALQIVNSLPQDEKIIFGPDRNLGSYINQATGRQMLLWDGACHVHDRFSVPRLLELKKAYPDAPVLAHPECRGALLKLADVVGSTAALLKYAASHDAPHYIVATEAGILHEMRRRCPQCDFIALPPEDGASPCNECEYMKLNTMQKLYNSLLHEWPLIEVDPDVAARAVKPIERMLEMSARLGL